MLDLRVFKKNNEEKQVVLEHEQEVQVAKTWLRGVVPEWELLSIWKQFNNLGTWEIKKECSGRTMEEDSKHNLTEFISHGVLKDKGSYY
jgi:hypothetical protein